MDWLRSRPTARIAGLRSMGTNVGLFTLGQDFVCPAQVSRPGSWISYFDSADVLGYPVAVRPELAHVQDVEVRVGSWLSRWNIGNTGLAHTMYWSSEKLWRQTIPAGL